MGDPVTARRRTVRELMDRPERPERTIVVEITESAARRVLEALERVWLMDDNPAADLRYGLRNLMELTSGRRR